MDITGEARKLLGKYKWDRIFDKMDLDLLNKINLKLLLSNQELLERYLIVHYQVYNEKFEIRG